MTSKAGGTVNIGRRSTRVGRSFRAIAQLGKGPEGRSSGFGPVAGEKSRLQCAGVNRHEGEDERALRVRSSDPLGPESCAATARDAVKRRQHSTVPWVRSPGTETWREAADLRACCWTRFGKLKPIPHWC